MNYGVIAYDASKNRWQWWSRYVSEADATAMYNRRIEDSDRVLFVQMAPAYHECNDTCPCIGSVIMKVSKL